MLGIMKKFRVVFVLILLILLVTLVISACSGISIGGFGETQQTGPTETAIIAPIDSRNPRPVAQVFAGSPVQIQSIHANANISRVELLVDNELLRADIPDNGFVIQRWTPEQPGRFEVRTRAYTGGQNPEYELSIQVEALPSENVVSIPKPQAPVSQAAGFDGPTPTPTLSVIIARPTEVSVPSTPQAQGNAQFQPPEPEPEPEAQIVVIESEDTAPEMMDEEEPIRYPPPPPAPGVPPGPTPKQMPKKIPPVCDAAEFISVFVEDVPSADRETQTRRIFLPGPDDEPVLVAAGTTVHRAWRLRNIGTCTWGPGYELSFYGGRDMGSGGVAFESTFPADIRPRNRLLDTNRLILPEGKPNQVAVLEVLLNTPAIPGIHQSYWRMRNPQGVYFGPILGVTMDVVRDCQAEPGDPRIYGAPVLSFRILGVDGNLVGPGEGVPGAGPLPLEVGQLVTIDWSVFNATNFQLIIENPTGDIDTITSTDPRDRANFTPTRVGLYTLTLFAENGVCVISQDIELDVRPPLDEQFVFDAAFSDNAPVVLPAGSEASLSQNVSAGTIEIAWQHADPDVGEVVFRADRYQRQLIPGECYFEDLFGETFCTGDRFGEWERSPIGISSQTRVGSSPSGAAVVSFGTQFSDGPPTEILSPPGDAAAETTGDDLSAAAQRASALGCPGLSTDNIQYGINYYLIAKKATGADAEPLVSNRIFAICGQNDDIEVGLPAEIGR